MPSSTTGVLPAAISSSLAAIDVDADDAVAVAREAGQRHRADVAETEDADVHAMLVGSELSFGVRKSRTQRSMMASSRCIELGQA